MSRRVLTLLLLLLPVTATAQSTHPMQSQDDLGDVAALSDVVFEGWVSNSIPILESERLAILYDEGRGVRRDAALACLLLDHALLSAVATHFDQTHPIVARIERGRAEVCGRRTDEEREAMQEITCPRFGFAERTEAFVFGSDRVEIGFRGVGVLSGSQQRRIPDLWPCFARSVFIRPVRVDRPEGESRHFFEWFAWQLDLSAGLLRRALVWRLWEVADGSAGLVAEQQLFVEPGRPWSAETPPTLPAVAFHMTEAGAVDWHFTDRRLNGTVAAPERIDEAEYLAATGVPFGKPVEEPPVARGTARLDVTVTDYLGAPRPGAEIEIQGLIERKAVSDGLGFAMFSDLPAGRYGVHVAFTGLIQATSMVVNLSDLAVTPVAITLKPIGSARISIACGGIDSSSIAGLARSAEVVVHVLIVAQHVEESRYVSGAYERRQLITVNRGRVLRSLRGDAFGPNPASMVEVRQPGGRIDRGTFIDLHHSSNIDPLSVGDEFLIFATRDDEGSLWAHDGQFVLRLRNGRVEPLGTGRIAAAWKGRSADNFLAFVSSRLNR